MSSRKKWYNQLKIVDNLQGFIYTPGSKLTCFKPQPQ